MRKAALSLSGIVLASIAAAPLLAQDDANEAEQPFAERPSAAQPTDNTIIITEDKSERREVLAGSRVAKRPIFVDGPIATSMGTPGLVPQSGMDPAGQYTRTKITTDCVSPDMPMSKAAACVMADAQEAFEAGDLRMADQQYGLITGSLQFTAAERLEAARWQFRIADQSGDDFAKESALLTMVATGAMTAAKEKSARRGLISMALRRSDRAEARERLAALDEAGMADARSLANLAILSREAGAVDAGKIMIRAIALTEAAGSSVPQGWRDFVVAERVAAEWVAGE